jgi:hypothetical protein
MTFSNDGNQSTRCSYLLLEGVLDVVKLCHWYARTIIARFRNAWSVIEVGLEVGDFLLFWNTWKSVTQGEGEDRICTYFDFVL